MPATYRVLIEPDEDENDAILEILLSEGHTEEQAKRILELGGTVAEHLELEEAEELRDHLEESGAVARIEPMDDRQPGESEMFIVLGTVEYDGYELSDLIVRAFDRDLRSEQPLGAATTDEQGYFEIEYRVDQFTRAEYGRPDIALRVSNAVGNRLEIRASSGELVDGEWIVFNAEPRETIYLEVLSNEKIVPSEFEILQTNYAIAAEGVPPADATRNDVQFLFHELETESGQLEALAASGRIARDIDIPMAAIYGWLRLDGPDDPDDLWEFTRENVLEVHPDTFLQTVEQAIEDNVIPASLFDSLEDIDEQLRRLREERRITLRRTITGILVDAETERPLVGYSVRVLDVTTGQDGSILLDEQITDIQGRFVVPFALPAEADTLRTLRLHVRSPAGEEIDLEDPEIEVDLDEEEFRVEIVVPKPGRVELTDSELREALNQATDDPEGLETVLSYLDETEEFGTLADIRTAGGLSAILARVDDPPVDPTDPIVELIDAHVDLSLLSNDAAVNARLFEKGYHNLFDIADTPVDTFTDDVVEETGFVELDAQRFHFSATANKRLLDSIRAGRAADLATNLETAALMTGDGEASTNGGFSKSCDCTDCDSAVSPRAYLAELLDFVRQRVSVHEDETTRDLFVDELAQTLHQRFGDLPAECETTEETLRQVRLCIEVLRRELDRTPPGSDVADALEEIEEGYRRSAYAALLERLGTSEDELRAAKGDPEEEASLAVSLGVAPDHLYSDSPGDLALLLDRDAVTEVNLEKVFGLVDTTRATRNQELKEERKDVEPSLLEQWQREQIRFRWREEDFPRTVFDPDAPLSNPDAPETERQPVVDPDVIGPDDFRNTFDSSVEFGIWEKRREWVDERLEALRAVSQGDPIPPITALLDQLGDNIGYTWASNSTTELRRPWSPPLSLVEIDRINTELSTGDADTVETALGELRDWMLREDEFLFIVDLREKERAHQRDSRNDGVTADERDELCSILVQVMKRAFRRVWIQEEDAATVTLNPTGGSASLTLDPRLFWRSLREPEPGEWPPSPDADDPLVAPEDIPLIDPDTVELKGLPEFEGSDEVLPDDCESELLEVGETELTDDRLETLATNFETAGTTARVWCARKLQLDRKRDAIESAYQEASGGESFEVVLKVAFGEGAAPPDADSWETLLLKWQAAIEAETPGDPDSEAAAREAREAIETRLHIPMKESTAEFEALLAFRARADPDEGRTQPSDAEWATLFDTLIVRYKQRDLWPEWVRAEDPVPYWRLLKTKLPKWRASTARRTAWQSALETRRRPPIIDPDRVHVEELVDLDSSETNPALDVWTRRNEMVGRIADLRDELERVNPGGSPEERFGEIVQRALGITLADLERLDERRRTGIDVRPRLDQLGLSRRAFHALLRYRETVSRGEDLHEEWDAVYDIGTQVLKTRLFAVWNDEERDVPEFTLGPMFFEFDEKAIIYPQYEDDSRWWRIDRTARRDWEDSLESRIEEQDGVVESLHEMVSAVEEETLPPLRNALLRALPIPSDELDPVSEGEDDLAARSEWVTDRFLIDAADSGCRETTRVAQAIETLQSLVFAIRTGQAEFDRDDRRFSLRDPDPNEPTLEQAWRWLGSYATWKAGVAMYLYPENLLYPTLRRKQTPGFRELVREIGTNRNLSPKNACDVARKYADYFTDVTSLIPEATCWIEAPIIEGEGCNRRVTDERDFLYMFARGNRGDLEPNSASHIYWSRYHPQVGQTYWEPIEKFEGISKILGAAPYEGNIYLFGRRENEPDLIIYLKYDVQSDTWSGVQELDLPEDVPHSVALIQKNQGVPELALIPQATTTGHASVTPAYNVREGPDSRDFEYPVSNVIRATIDPIEGGWSHEEWESADSQRGPFIFGDSLHAAIELDSGIALFTQFSTDKVNLLRQNLGSLLEKEYQRDVVIEPLREYSQYDGQITVEYVPNRQLKVAAGLSAGYHYYVRVGSENTGIFLHPGYAEPKPIFPSSSRWLGAYQWDEFNIYAFGNRGIYREIHQETVRGTWGSHLNIGPSRKLSSGWGFSGITHLPVHSGSSADHRLAWLLLARWMTLILLFGPAFPEGTEAKSYVSLSVSQLNRSADGQLNVTQPTLVAPQYDDPKTIRIPESLDDQEREKRRERIRNAYSAANFGPLTNFTYIEEAYYFVPIYLALRLHRSGEYEAALEWFQTVYDYSADLSERKVYYGLVAEEDKPTALTRDETWLFDPRDIHGIASTRRHAYTRYTLYSIIGCLLDYADAEFTRDTSESIARARTLYMTALDLLEAPELKRVSDPCEEYSIEIYPGAQRPGTWFPPEVFRFEEDEDRYGLGGELTIKSDVTRFGREWKKVYEINGVDPDSLNDEEKAREVRRFLGVVVPYLPFVSRRIDQIEDLKRRRETIEAIQSTLIGDTTSSLEDRMEATIEIATNAARDGPSQTIGEVVEALPKQQTAAYRTLVTDESIVDGIISAKSVATSAFNRWAIHAGFLDSETDNGTVVPDGGEAASELPELYRTDEPTFRAYIGFCIPNNPLLLAFEVRAVMNLYKLRNCMNIAGMRREVEPYAAPLDIESSLPTLGPDGQLRVPTDAPLQPTQYRYSALAARAKELVGLAQQVESSLLSALQARDQEAYSRLKARQDVQTARSNITLQRLRVNEAELGVDLAELQEERALTTFEYYEGLIDAGNLPIENVALGLLAGASAAQFVSAGLYFTDALRPLGGGGISSTAAGFSATGSALASLSSFFSQLASYKRREQEWKHQRELARVDQRIASQQTQIAEAHVRVVEQEREISELQYDHADEVVEFLDAKFTNVELYDWMIGVLEGVYRYFIQQATAVARLAEQQLAFERQEIPAAIIKADYWEVPKEGQIQTPGGDGEGQDRRGLTGSARLLQDIYRLDQYAFETDERKLQLTKTVSLAQQYPYEFQRFRETGVLTFDTPMEVFDRDFPGHYLRLIKQVRTSVLALVPPTEGIKATLLNAGTSRVVTRGPLFPERRITRTPESVALTSPQDATGLFDLQSDPAPEKLLPFEGTGVDTRWELRMPKAANRFDYESIADVLVTIEYTALDSYDYRQQVLGELDPDLEIDRAFSLRREFADQWFDLHNSDPDSEAVTVSFQTREDDFPPNLVDLRTSGLFLYVAAEELDDEFETDLTTEAIDDLDVTLSFAERGESRNDGGATSPVDGVITTGRIGAGVANGAAWRSLTRNKAPVGEWTLTFSVPRTSRSGLDIQSLFADERIEDILFVVSCQGRTPEWPE